MPDSAPGMGQLCLYVQTVRREQPHRKGSLVSGWQQVESESAVRPGSQNSPLYPGVEQASIAAKWWKAAGAALPSSTMCRFWHHDVKRDIKLLESIQRRTTKIMKCPDGKTYEEWLRPLKRISFSSLPQHSVTQRNGFHYLVCKKSGHFFLSLCNNKPLWTFKDSSIN